MTTSTSHRTESLSLQPDGLVDLWQITLRGNVGILRIKDNETVTWQGQVWESMSIQLQGDQQSADGEDARPKLSIVNPFGLFTPHVLSGVLEYSIVVRKRVLYQNIINDVNVYEQRMWKVCRIPQFISGQSITMELMSMTEGPAFQVPVRSYVPPVFPSVSLVSA